VIKLEPPEGDVVRFDFPRVSGTSGYYAQQNTGKRNISLDLDRPEAVALVRRLAERCDVVVENFRPGVADRLGLGYDALSSGNPRLVYGSISGYGQTGPWRDRRAYAAVIQAEMGLTATQGDERGGAYANDSFSYADLFAAKELTTGILAALVRRERTGRGQRVEVSMAEALLYMDEHVHWELSERDGAEEIPSFRPADYPVLQVANGRRVVVAGHPCATGNFTAWSRLIGRPELLDDPRFATVGSRRRHYAELLEALAQWAATVPDEETFEALVGRERFAAGTLRHVREVAASDWARERDAIVEVSDRRGGWFHVPNAPWRFSADEVGVRGVPAYRGEDNRAVLGALLGLDDDTLERLEADGVLSSRIPR
jgi:crotonobetainyl-CoA:carnitine CoA-transferase CaiB-like acyl-CoA transferase